MLNYYFGSFVPLRKPVVSAVEGAFPTPFRWSRYQQYNKGGNFFEDIGNSVGSFFSDPIGYTGDRLAEIDKTIIQPVYREVIQPVGKVLEGVGQAIANDPITFVAQLAAVALAPVTAGQSLWAIPVIQGISTAAHGGDVTDIVKSVAISAATTWVGGQIGSYVTSGMQTGAAGSYQLLGQAIERTTAQTIGNVVGYSAAGALGAAAAGKNGDQILTSALAGGAGAAIPLVLGNIPGFDALAAGKVEGIAPDVSKAIANGIAGTAGSIVGAAVTGKDVGAAAAAGLITAGINGLISTKNMVTDLFKDAGNAVGISNLSPQTQAVLANTMAGVFSTALVGGKAGNILQQSMIAIGTQALQGAITDSIKSGTEAVKNYFGEAETAQNKYNTEKTTLEQTIATRNSVAESMNDIVESQQSLAAQFERGDINLDTYTYRAQQLTTQYQQQYATYESYANQANAMVASVNAKGNATNTLAGKVNAAAKQVNDTIANQKWHVDQYNAKLAALDPLVNRYNSAVQQEAVVATDRVYAGEGNRAYLPPGTQVAYGANGAYAYATVGSEGYIDFTNDRFGDPINGTYKYGYAITFGGYTSAELESMRTDINNRRSDAENYATVANQLGTQANQQKSAYDSLNSQYQSAVTDYQKTKASYDSVLGSTKTAADKVTSTANQLNQVNTSINQQVEELKAINSQITSLNNQYTNLDSQLDTYDATIKTSESNLVNYKNQFETATEKLESAATPLTQQINELTQKINNELVANLDPNFNAAEYKQLNGLGEGIDAATHWLSIGKDAGLYTNNAVAESAKNQAAYSLVSQIAKARGYDGAFQLPKEELSKVFNDVLNHYGNDVFAMEAATPETFAWESKVPTANRVSEYDPSKLAQTVEAKATYGGWNAPDNLKLPSGFKLASAEEYASGKSTLIQLKDGSVAYTVSDNSQKTKAVNSEGNLVDVPVGGTAEKGPDGEWHISVGEGETGMHIIIRGAAGYEEAPGVVEKVDPMEDDPLQAMYTFNTMDPALLGDWSKPGERIIEGSKAIIAWAEEKAKTGESSDVLAIASSVVGGFGEQFQSFAGLAALVGTQPETTDLYKLGQSLIDLKKASTPADFAKRYEEFQAQYQNVQGLSKGWAFVKAAVNSPSEFLIGMAIPEITQELIPTLVGVATGGMSKAIGTGAGALAKVAPKVAEWVGKWGGVAGSAASDVVESFGANYNDTYSEAKTLAAKAHPEWSRQQIEEYATNQGLTVGMMGALTTGVSMGLGGAALAKSLLGPKATDEAVSGMTGWLDQLASKITTTGKIMVKEGASEAIVEEIPTQLVKDLLFLPIDPNRDIAGNLSLAGAQAFMTAGATTGTISAAHQTATGMAELALNANEAFMNAINGTNGNAAQLGNVLNQWLPTTTTQGADLRNTIVPAIFEEHPEWGLQYATPEDYARTVSTLGVKDPVALTELVDKRFDTAVTTSDELATDLYNKGLTDVTVKDIQAVLGTGTSTPTQVNTAAQQYVDANMVDVGEVQSAAAQEGYKYTQVEMDNLVGRGVEAEVIQKFIQEVDPKAVNKAEATQYFLDQGYDKARAEDIAQFVKSAPETEVQAAVAAWVDPRQVTRQEAIEFYGPYTPTEEEINRYIVQGPEVAEEAIRKQVEEYVDPRYVTAEEVGELAKQRGLNVPVAESDIARLTGQYAESELSGKFEKDLPVISANATYAATKKAEQTLADKIAANEAAGMARDQAMQLAIEDTAAELGTTRTEILNKIDITSQQFQNEINIAKTDINKQLVTVEQGLKSEIQNVSAILGKPATQVTAADVEMVRTMLAGDINVDLAFDTNNDNKIDINDQINLQTQLDINTNNNITTKVDPNTGLTVYTRTDTGEPVEPTTLTGSKWTASGLYEELEKQKAQQAATAKAQAAATKTASQKSQFGSLMGMLFQAPDALGQQVSVKTPDPARINYIYDFSSIFANPSQASMMPSPYGPANTVAPKQPQQPQQPQQAANQPLFQLASGFAEGGIVGSNDIQVGGSLDDLLEILKGN